jgi:hypothetical protein
MDGIGHGLVFIKAFQLKRRNENDHKKQEGREEIMGIWTHLAI